MSGRNETVPVCKGCGSRNIRALARAEISSEYNDPTHVDEFGHLHFAHSYSGYGENERWRFECEDCGRGMRTSLVPVHDD